MSGFVERIVVRVTPEEKKALAAKAKRFGLPMSELLRRGAAAYQSVGYEADLQALAEAARSAVDRAAVSIDDSLDFIAASNRRIAAMEARAAQRPQERLTGN